MLTYPLYLESGPRKKTTMVHVIDLLGCTVHGSTTEEALARAPETIRAYLAFLHWHGEAVDPAQPFTTEVAQHIMEGPWIGYGDPASGFRPDFDPLEEADLALYLRRFGWLRRAVVELVRDLPPERLLAKPAEGGRPLLDIVQHLAESSTVYLRYLVGKVNGVGEALRALQPEPPFVEDSLLRLLELITARLGALSPAERSLLVPHGQVIWSARRAFRRTLEHEWEHLLEIERKTR